MDKKKTENALRAIGLALSASNGVIANDNPDLKPDKGEWTIDNSKELEALEYIEALFSISTDTCPLCGRCNSRL